MISQQEVRHIAKLARLGLTEKEVEKFRKDLSKILDYIEKLKEIDISEVSPTSHSTSVKNIMRKDEQEIKSKKESTKLLKLSPEAKNGYLKVKSILKQ